MTPRPEPITTEPLLCWFCRQITDQERQRDGTYRCQACGCKNKKEKDNE